MATAPPDRIEILGLAVPAIIGVFDWERKVRQTVVLDLSMETDVRRPGRTDRLADALDYKAVSKRVQALVKASRFRLVEALAEEVARTLLGEFGARRATVRVEKPGALRGARTVAVVITRSRRGR
jgi:dihydroneopterin aldolase